MFMCQRPCLTSIAITSHERDPVHLYAQQICRLQFTSILAVYKNAVDLGPAGVFKRLYTCVCR